VQARLALDGFAVVVPCLRLYMAEVLLLSSYPCLSIGLFSLERSASMSFSGNEIFVSFLLEPMATACLYCVVLGRISIIYVASLAVDGGVEKLSD